MSCAYFAGDEREPPEQLVRRAPIEDTRFLGALEHAAHLVLGEEAVQGTS